MIGMAGYAVRSPIPWGSLIVRAIEKAGKTQKEMYLGRVDQAEWTRMMTGHASLDLNKLAICLPLGVWLEFFPLAIGAVVKHFMSTRIDEEAA